jgi:hypothetical protein
MTLHWLEHLLSTRYRRLWAIVVLTVAMVSVAYVAFTPLI